MIGGNIKELGNWKLPIALESDPKYEFHSITLTLPRFCDVCIFTSQSFFIINHISWCNQFEYKYLLQTNEVAVWEEGPNRLFTLQQGLTGVSISDQWQVKILCKIMG